MRKAVAILLALVMLCGAALAETYSGSARGFGGDVKVDVTIEDGRVIAVSVDDSTESYSQNPTVDEADRPQSMDALVEAILSAGGTDGVDALTNATLTSNAVLDVVNEALAGGKPELSDAVISFTPGTYEGEADGRNGKIRVSVTCSEDAIESIAVDEASLIETDGVWETPVSQIPAAIVESQTLSVDIVTGATMTSNGIIAAVKDALAKAGGNPDLLYRDAEAHAPETVEKTVDVLVVGAGLSGLSAAIAAKEAGADTLLIEKEGYAGGDTILSTGVFNLGGTDLQAENGIEDSQEAFAEYLSWASSHLGGERDPVLVQMVSQNANDMYHWLLDHGVHFDSEVFPVIGSDTLRGHQSLPGAPGLIKDLLAAAVADGVDIQYDTAAISIITEDDGSVSGVVAQRRNGDTWIIHAKAVIMCTGGFGQSDELKHKYWDPMLNSWGVSASLLIPVCAPGATGEMMEEIIDMGAATRDMALPATSPTVSADGRTLISSLMLSNGSILVKSDGTRYTDESASYGEIALATLALLPNDPFVYEIFDETVVDNFFKAKDYIAYGHTVQADTLEELAGLIDMPADALLATVETYNQACAGETEDPFGRQHLQGGLHKAPYYAMAVKSGAVVLTSGGLQIDENSHVVKADGSIIPGLYAAGEIVGGYQGFGYAGGDSLAMASTTARTAGQSAVAIECGQ